MSDSSNNERMAVLAIQPAIGKVDTGERKTAHLRQLAAKVEKLILSGWGDRVGLVVLPELASIDYSDAAFENLDELAEPLHGETFQVFSEIARRHSLYIATGMARREGASRFISHIVINPAGALATWYDKIHIAHFGLSREKRYFQRGNAMSFFDLGLFRVGVVICYDFRFSEYIRTLVRKHGVNVVLHPVAFARDGSYPSWHHFAITRALENQVYFLSLNRAGESWGSSILCPPWIDDDIRPRVFGSAEESCIFKLKYEEIISARRTYRFADDQLDDYGSLRRCSPGGGEE